MVGKPTHPPTHSPGQGSQVTRVVRCCMHPHARPCWLQLEAARIDEGCELWGVPALRGEQSLRVSAAGVPAASCLSMHLSAAEAERPLGLSASQQVITVVHASPAGGVL